MLPLPCPHIPPQTPPAAFVHALRVYWEDTDAGGVVFYANYLKFFERARTEWLRSRGVEQQALRETSGAIFVVTQTQVQYKAPARLDDLLQISVVVQRCAGATLAFEQQAHCGALLLAQGQIEVACVHAHNFKPRRLPQPLAQQILDTLAP
jgi:acyl-CoA thioester hydrolase